MKLLVTGLCLSRNLGGPAMALTLVDQLASKLPDVDFIFAIDGKYYNEEKKWADYYGLKIVPRDDLFVIKMARIAYRALTGNPISLEGLRWQSRIHKQFMQAYRNCNAVINMMGISYVGDGARGPLEGLSSYTNLYFANRNRKPFTHFIQSFGPFDDWKVRFFAKRDFKQADFIPARGRLSAEYCRRIIKNPEKVYDFPDIAILLPRAAEQWTEDYLRKLELTEKSYTVLSPSSAIYNMRPTAGVSMGEDHVRSFYLAASKLLSDGETLLFLPHMYSNDKRQCDREICHKVVNLLRNSVNDVIPCKIIRDDLDVWQAKALIAKSKTAVVSRYHALVAALSTGVPVVTVGWNIKYSDLMHYYGIESMAIDARKNDPQQIAGQVTDHLTEYQSKDYTGLLKEKQRENIRKVEAGIDLLCHWLKQHVN